MGKHESELDAVKAQLVAVEQQLFAYQSKLVAVQSELTAFKTQQNTAATPQLRKDVFIWSEQALQRIVDDVKQRNSEDGFDGITQLADRLDKLGLWSAAICFRWKPTACTRLRLAHKLAKPRTQSRRSRSQHTPSATPSLMCSGWRQS